MVLLALWNVFEPAPHSQINTQLLHSWTVRPSKFLKENVHLEDRRTSILGILHFKVTWHNELTNPNFYGCVVISLSRKAKVTLKHGPISWPRPGHRVTGTPETIHHAGTTQQPTKGHNTGHHTGASSTSSRHPMPWQFYFRIPWLHPRLSHDCCQFNVAMNLVKVWERVLLAMMWISLQKVYSSHLVCTVHLVGRHLVDYIHCARTLHLQPIYSKWQKHHCLSHNVLSFFHPFLPSHMVFLKYANISIDAPTENHHAWA